MEENMGIFQKLNFKLAYNTAITTKDILKKTKNTNLNR